MRRLTALVTRLAVSPTVALVLALGLAVVLVGGRAQAGAQEATPAPGPIQPTITGEIAFLEEIGFGTVDALPPAPASIGFIRVEVAPGAGVAYPPGDPGLGAHLVESGTLTLRNFSEDIVVTRAAGEGTPGPQASEVLPAGTETQLGPGDGFFFPPVVAGEFHNDGTEPVVLAIVLIFPEAGTPDAGAVSGTPAP